MELAFNKGKNLASVEEAKYWDDILIQDFYLNYYQNLNSRELDKELNKDIKLLTDVLRKLPVSNRKGFILVLSKLIEFYLETKIEKEIDNSLFKILKF